MAIGDVKIHEFKIGGLDLNNPNQAYPHEISICEDILDVYGPVLECRVVDPNDAVATNKVNGAYNQDVSIRFSDERGKVAAFKLKQFENNNTNDESGNQQGSLRAKTYTLKCVSKELLDAQGNYVEKSWNDKTTKMVEDVLKNYFKTDKSIECDDQAREKRRWVASNQHPKEVIQDLNDEHVASQSKSSLYCVFQQQRNGTQKYKISTFEKLFQQAPVATYKQSTVLDSSASTEDDKKFSILNMNVGENFFSGTRHLTRSSEQTFNLTTHGVVTTDPKNENYTVLGQKVYEGKASNAKLVPQSKTYSKVNETEKNTPADAKAKRAEFASLLAQNSCEIVIPGNPDLHVGCVITLQIPKKIGTTTGGGMETQFNDKVLITQLRHVIQPPGAEGGPDNPQNKTRYTMIARCVKAGWVQGGGQA